MNHRDHGGGEQPVHPLSGIATCGTRGAYLDRAGLSQGEAWLVIGRAGARHDARYYLDSRIRPAFSSCT
jgi:hypothetical protein